MDARESHCLRPPSSEATAEGEGEIQIGGGREGDRERVRDGESARARGEGREGALATLEYHLSFYVLRYTATCVTVSFGSKGVLAGD